MLVKEVHLEAKKTKYMLLSSHQIAGQNHGKRQQSDHLKMWHRSNIWEQQ
jgi:hypothetical protein